MMAQAALSVLLFGVVAYAMNERRRSPAVASLSMAAAVAGLYFTWMPDHATDLALWAESAAASTSSSISGCASP